MLDQDVKKIHTPRLELGISCVLGRRHNQLDHACAVHETGFFDQWMSVRHGFVKFFRFDSPASGSRICIGSRLAQLVERKTLNLVVVGSSPTVGGTFSACSVMAIIDASQALDPGSIPGRRTMSILVF